MCVRVGAVALVIACVGLARVASGRLAARPSLNHPRARVLLSRPPPPADNTKDGAGSGNTPVGGRASSDPPTTSCVQYRARIELLNGGTLAPVTLPVLSITVADFNADSGTGTDAPAAAASLDERIYFQASGTRAEPAGGAWERGWRWHALAALPRGACTSAPAGRGTGRACPLGEPAAAVRLDPSPRSRAGPHSCAPQKQNLVGISATSNLDVYPITYADKEYTALHALTTGGDAQLTYKDVSTIDYVQLRDGAGGLIYLDFQGTTTGGACTSAP